MLRVVKIIAVILMAPVILFSAGPVLAGELESSMEAFLVQVDAKGAEVLESADSALPGETVEYRTTYKNNGDSLLTGLVVETPVPANTVYVPGSARSQTPHELVVSIDGGATWDSEPVKRLLKGPDGVEEETIISPEQYTHLRWIAREPIQPGEAQVYRCRVRIQ